MSSFFLSLSLFLFLLLSFPEMFRGIMLNSLGHFRLNRFILTAGGLHVFPILSLRLLTSNLDPLQVRSSYFGGPTLSCRKCLHKNTDVKREEGKQSLSLAVGLEGLCQSEIWRQEFKKIKHNKSVCANAFWSIQTLSPPQPPFRSWSFFEPVKTQVHKLS